MHAIAWRRPIVSIGDAFDSCMMDDRRKHDEYMVREIGSGINKSANEATKQPSVTTAAEEQRGGGGPQLKPTGRSTAAGHMTQLAGDFEPGEQDVVCGRGKKYERTILLMASACSQQALLLLSWQVLHTSGQR
jgi:hypothetical protein